MHPLFSVHLCLLPSFLRTPTRQLAGIFMLHWSTMAFGFLTEYIALPKAGVDRNIYKYPVGAVQWHEWKQGKRSFTTNYREDPRALKILSQASPFRCRANTHCSDA